MRQTGRCLSNGEKLLGDTNGLSWSPKMPNIEPGKLGSEGFSVVPGRGGMEG